MKKYFLAAFAAVSVCLCAWADDFRPKTGWPYVYDNFEQGRYTDKVGNSREGLFNVNVVNGRLHYIDADMINEALPGEAFAVRIGQDCYLNTRLRMMKVLASNEHGFVVLDREVDYVALNSTGGAYGSSSSTLGTRPLSSVEGLSGVSYQGMNHMEIRAHKEGGQTLPLIEKIYVVGGGMTVYATKRDIAAAVEDKDALNLFLREHKIKWKDPQSLLQIVDFLDSQK